MITFWVWSSGIFLASIGYAAIPNVITLLSYLRQDHQSGWSTWMHSSIYCLFLCPLSAWYSSEIWGKAEDLKESAMLRFQVTDTLQICILFTQTSEL